jgi:hypothetical protein
MRRKMSIVFIEPETEPGYLANEPGSVSGSIKLYKIGGVG